VLLPTRQLGRIARAERVELHQLEQLAHGAADLLPARTLAARPHAKAERHVLEHGHVAEQSVVLEDVPDAPVARAQRRGVLAMDEHRASVERL
jgi:predicted LPLAT superfamily acyltransferase